MATAYNIDHTRGDSLILALTIEDYRELPLDISNCSALMTVKDSSDVLVFQVGTTTGEITLPAPTAGQMLITVPPGATSSVNLGGQAIVRDKYDVRMTLAGSVCTLVSGMFTIREEISEAP